MTREEHLKSVWEVTERICSECVYRWSFLEGNICNDECRNWDRRRAVKRLMEKACITNT